MTYGRYRSGAVRYRWDGAFRRVSGWRKRRWTSIGLSKGGIVGEEITRREALKQGALLGGAALVWVRPSVQTYGMSATLAAQASGTAGCTPGFWKNNPGRWPNGIVAPADPAPWTVHRDRSPLPLRTPWHSRVAAVSQAQSGFCSVLPRQDTSTPCRSAGTNSARAISHRW